MTLIAAWKEDGVPFLIGDLVLGSLGDFTEPHYRLPTRDDLDDVLPHEWNRQIVGTCQKIYKISDSLVVGWIDRKITAKRIIQELYGAFVNQKPSLADVQNLLRDIGDPTDAPCLLVGWIIEGGIPRGFRWFSKSPNEVQEGELFVEGSGSDYFKEIFVPSSSCGANDPVNKALTKITNLLGHEVLYGTNLWNLFGGGFQVIHLQSGLFSILQSATYIFLYAKEEEDNILFGHERRILKYRYENEIVQSLALLSNRDALGTPQLYYTFPISAEPGIDYSVSSNLSLRSEYYCVFIDIICKDGLRAECVISVSDEKKDSILKIIQGPGTIEGLALGENLYRTVVNFLKNLDRDKSKYSHRKWLS